MCCKDCPQVLIEYINAVVAGGTLRKAVQEFDTVVDTFDAHESGGRRKGQECGSFARSKLGHEDLLEPLRVEHTPGIIPEPFYWDEATPWNSVLVNDHEDQLTLGDLLNKLPSAGSEHLFGIGEFLVHLIPPR